MRVELTGDQESDSDWTWSDAGRGGMLDVGEIMCMVRSRRGMDRRLSTPKAVLCLEQTSM